MAKLELKTDTGEDLFRRNLTEPTKYSAGKKTFSKKEVYYYYMDTEVTITIKGSKGAYNDSYKDINLEFKKGWNALYSTTEFIETETESTSTTSYSISNPALDWSL
jgi:hypothetical protein